jgi:ketosteroid isomerase-like protein
MIRATVGLCLLLGLTGAADKTDKAAPTPKEFLESWAEAWKSGKVDQLLSFYEESKDLIAVASSGHSFKGMAEVRKMYEAAFSEATWERVTLEGLEIRQGGDTAWGTCRFKADFAPKADKAKLLFTSQGSFVLRKQGGSWKIALEHFSPIADVPRVQPRKS